MKETIRVLYAEDNPSDADLTTARFEVDAPDFELEVVNTGRECLARLPAGTYDVLLLDNHLPDMDGIELLKELAEKELPLPVVMVTAVGDEDLVVRVLRLGAWDYVPKQGNYVEKLPAVLRNAVTEYRRPDTGGRVTGRQQRRILYAEHHAADIDLTLSHFAVAAPHFQIEIVRSARHALTRLQEGHVDLLLTDLRLPDLNALELLREARHQGLQVPFVIITGKGDEATAVASLTLGAYDYIVKRDNYLTQLPYAIENAIHRAQLVQMNRRLQIELAERKRAEEQLRQAQKMESIGRLAGGVAHDFNNLLTVIIGYADQMWQDLGPNNPLRVILSEIRTAAERAADLTRQLLAFSRRQLLQPRALVLNSLIADTTKMLTRLLGDDIELITILDPDLGTVMADAGQMDQVIMNLAINARDAMPSGGKLTLRTQNVVLDEAYVQGDVSLPPGSYVLLTVSDTGAGMNAQTLAHVFEPFFTTKEQGQGTGLGLSTVYGIVKQSGGWIWVHSDRGHGTTFEIYLPRVEEPVTEAEKKSEPQSPRGSETILVVEDDEMVRKLISQALRNYGYGVIEAAGGSEALRVCSEHQSLIPLMIADVVMPSMSGRELAAQLRWSHPEMRVLYISGYTDDAVVRHAVLDSAMSFLQKPFTPSALARKVRDVLEQRHDSPLR